MHPDDDSQTTLSKWPFILGDVLLVATALAIAILGGWQLTNWQVAACVAAVALGAALFVLPYVVEFQVRVREEREDRGADLRVLEKHLRSAEEGLTAIDARMRALENAAADAGQPDAELTGMIDQKFSQLETARASQEAVLQALRQKVEEHCQEAPPAFDPELLKSMERRLQALEARPEIKPEPEAGYETKASEPDPAEASSQGATSPIQEKPKPEKTEKTGHDIERPTRSVRERHGPQESRLLRRAISEEGDNSSAAVSRIIGAKGKAQASETAPGHEMPAPDSEQSAPPAESAKSEANEPATEATKAAEAPAAEAVKPDPDKKARLDESASQEDAPEEETPGMLFEEEKITSPLVRTKAKKNDAVVTASVFIGIGNKPYLRGSGGGLDWERGALMEFQEIGKWRWVAPSGLDDSLEVQVYCNDEEPDKSGKHTVEPGQKLEIKPVF